MTKLDSITKWDVFETHRTYLSVHSVPGERDVLNVRCGYGSRRRRRRRDRGQGYGARDCRPDLAHTPVIVVAYLML